MVTGLRLRVLPTLCASQEEGSTSHTEEVTVSILIVQRLTEITLITRAKSYPTISQVTQGSVQL